MSGKVAAMGGGDGGGNTHQSQQATVEATPHHPSYTEPTQSSSSRMASATQKGKAKHKNLVCILESSIKDRMEKVHKACHAPSTSAFAPPPNQQTTPSPPTPTSKE